MEYSYIAYTADKKLVKGKLSATNEQAATSLLSYGGYQVVSLKQVVPFFNTEKLAASFSRVKTREIIMFSRQMALLLESGTDIVTSLDLLQGQITNKTLKKVIGEVASDIRGGSSLSTALSKHPRSFSQMYHRAIAAGEQGGNLEVVLRQMADYMERIDLTEKKIKSAMAYPIIVAVVGLAVVAILVTFVLPSFSTLYTTFNTELPFVTKLLLSITDWLSKYGLYLIGVIIIALGIGLAYARTPAGKYQWDKISLKLPVVGRIFLLNELSSRTISLLFKVGVPLPEIISMVTQGTSNKAMAEALAGVQQELIRGEGISRPMARRSLFLPLMVQMVSVGEETGSLDNTLATVANSYEAESDDRTSAAVALLQPAMIVAISLVIGFVAIALVSAMYSIYGQVNI
ncbi:type II secretion system F family protein [Chloroflexota bacterium]